MTALDMDYGGVDKRKTKKDLIKKRLARGYKRGGKFRTMEIDESTNKSGKKTKSKKKL